MDVHRETIDESSQHPTGVDLEEVMSLRHDKKYMSYMLCFALKL
jgi:hypothetical protein